MDILKTTLIALAVSALVVVGYGVLTHKDSSGNSVLPALGALAGPDIASPYLQWGGVYIYHGSMTTLTQNASTTCAIQSPAATSTLVYGAIRFDLASTSASEIELGKSANQFSTTTSLGIVNVVAANAQVTIVASTTSNGGADPAQVFAPNTYFTVKIGGGGTGSVPTGKCEARFITD